MTPAVPLLFIPGRRKHMNPRSQMKNAGTRRPVCEPLENRLLCRIVTNGEFVITPPGDGEGHSAIILHPIEGVAGLRTADAQSNGVVDWHVTRIRVWTPGDPGGPNSAV